MSSKRREYHVDCRAKKAALFFLACEANPATRLSLPAAMRAKGYSDVEAADRILVQQVHHESQKKAPKDTPRPESVAASSLLALATVATTTRPALRLILTKQTVAPVIVVGGIDASILLSPERKVRKTSHKEQIGKQNKSRGCTGDFSKKKNIFKHFFSQAQTCRYGVLYEISSMWISKKVIFLRFMCVFSCFFLVLLGKMHFWMVFLLFSLLFCINIFI